MMLTKMMMMITVVWDRDDEDVFDVEEVAGCDGGGVI